MPDVADVKAAGGRTGGGAGGKGKKLVSKKSTVRTSESDATEALAS